MNRIRLAVFQFTTVGLFMLFCAGSFAAVKELNVTCSTDGEGVDLFLTIKNGITSPLKGGFVAKFSSEETIKLSSDLYDSEFVDLLSGKATSIVGRSKSSQANGGAISDAGLLAFNSADINTNKRKAVLALNGIVYLINCTLEIK